MTGESRSAAGERSPAASAFTDRLDWRERRDRPVYRAVLWPHRPLNARGRKVAVGVAAGGLTVPLLPQLGTPVFWALLPFMAVALGLLWFSLRRSDRDGRLTEEVMVWRDEVRVERREPDGRVRRWSADPYKVRLTLHPKAKVENYLTARGPGREIELGAFLTPEERVAFAAELEGALTRAIRA